MPKFSLAHFFLISAIFLSSITSANAQSSPKIHAGSFFDVTYPGNFVVNAPTTDEAYLRSPDNRVEFFVYSPQWYGKPETYLIIKSYEKLVEDINRKTSAKGVYRDYIQTRWVTVVAKDGSYTRSFVHRRACHTASSSDCVSSVFGIKYADKQTYDQYRDAYIAFKKSLVQYAD